MDLKKHFIAQIDRVEYYTIKELEYSLYGLGETCFSLIYDRLTMCIRARKAIDYRPCQSVAELLERSAYSDQFIKRFLNRIPHLHEDIFEDEEVTSLRDRLMQLIFMHERYITRFIEQNLICAPEPYFVSYYMQLEECLEARRANNFLPFASVEELLRDWGYNNEFIQQFTDRVNAERQQDY